MPADRYIFAEQFVGGRPAGWQCAVVHQLCAVTTVVVVVAITRADVTYDVRPSVRPTMYRCDDDDDDGGGGGGGATHRRGRFDSSLPS